jgi:hypothetical protein
MKVAAGSLRVTRASAAEEEERILKKVNEGAGVSRNRNRVEW